MRQVDWSDVAANLDELLDEVERGATIVIVRNGRAVARIVPVQLHEAATVSRSQPPSE